MAPAKAGSSIKGTLRTFHRFDPLHITQKALAGHDRGPGRADGL